MAFDTGEILLTIIRNFVNLLPFKKIHSYERGVIFSFGNDKAQITKPGIYFFCPYFQSIEILDTRYDGIVAKVSIETTDEVSITLFGNLIYRIRNARLCYTKVGDNEEVKNELEKIAEGELSKVAGKYSYKQIRTREPFIHHDEKSKKESQVFETPLVSAVSHPHKLDSSEKSYKGDGGDGADEDEEEFIPTIGISELEQRVMNELQNKVKKWGVAIYYFSIKDFQKTKGYRIVQDINTASR